MASTPILTKTWDNYKIPIILGVTSILLILVSVVLLLKSIQTTSPIEFSRESGETDKNILSSSSAQRESTLIVDIEGAVVSPGLYHLPIGSRIDDLITAAGGFSKEADEGRISQIINRAAKLVDGGKIYIPNNVDVQNAETRAQSVNTESGASSVIVSVNTATSTELDRLPGIGPVTANNIISSRPYQSLTELVSRKVLSQGLYDKLKDQLSL